MLGLNSPDISVNLEVEDPDMNQGSKNPTFIDLSSDSVSDTALKPGL